MLYSNALVPSGHEPGVRHKLGIAHRDILAREHHAGSKKVQNWRVRTATPLAVAERARNTTWAPEIVASGSYEPKVTSSVSSSSSSSQAYRLSQGLTSMKTFRTMLQNGTETVLFLRHDPSKCLTITEVLDHEECILYTGSCPKDSVTCLAV
ncbi:unnamed protein product [Peronospora farinosa]|uniref:Uncharacterized protein n=1 Tax=Peronospora farinosa TaxID=134698 RepID=A0AAV0TDT1_9STRA|nr:unnamed protein product [Peronospora farinosa]